MTVFNYNFRYRNGKGFNAACAASVLGCFSLFSPFLRWSSSCGPRAVLRPGLPRLNLPSSSWIGRWTSSSQTTFDFCSCPRSAAYTQSLWARSPPSFSDWCPWRWAPIWCRFFSHQSYTKSTSTWTPSQGCVICDVCASIMTSLSVSI